MAGEAKEEDQAMDPVNVNDTVAVLKLGEREVRLVKAAPDVFRAAFAAARPVLPFGEFTVPPDRYDYENAENFLTEDGLAGFSAGKNGWLMSLFSILPERGFLRAVAPIMREAGNKLNCMVGANCTLHLVEAYEAAGFFKCAETVDDAALLRKLYGDRYVDDFIRDFGTPSHVFMVNRDWRDLGSVDAPEAIGLNGGVPVFPDYYSGKSYTAALAERLGRAKEV